MGHSILMKKKYLILTIGTLYYLLAMLVYLASIDGHITPHLCGSCFWGAPFEYFGEGMPDVARGGRVVAEGGGCSGAAYPRGGVRFSGGSGGDRTSASRSSSFWLACCSRCRFFFFFFGGLPPSRLRFGLGAFSSGINIGGGRIFLPSIPTKQQQDCTLNYWYEYLYMFLLQIIKIV